MPIFFTLKGVLAGKNTFIKFNLYFIIFLLLTSINVYGNQTLGNQLFEKGVAAYKAGNYELAITQFQKAHKKGIKSAATDYNLGVCYYKLKRYQDAQIHFLRLTKSKSNAPLAHYNLGLVAQKLKKHSAAINHFRMAYNTANNQKIRILAAAQLSPEKKQPKQDIFRGTISISAGFDDNVSLVSDEDDSTSMQKDQFLELFASLRSQLYGNSEDGFQVRFMGFAAEYLDINEYDFMNFGIKPEYNLIIGKWQTGFSGNLNFLYLDRQSFENIYGLELRGNRPISNRFNIALNYKLDFVDGNSDYSYLSGRRHKISSEIYAIFPKTIPTIGYTFELNNRDDNTYPSRHELFINIRQYIVENLKASLRCDYRYSDYKRISRTDKRLRIGGGVSYLFEKKIQGFGKYTYTQNTSNEVANEYTSNTFSLGVKYYF